MDKKMPCSITEGEQYDDFHLPEETERQREAREIAEDLNRVLEEIAFREMWEEING